MNASVHDVGVDWVFGVHSVRALLDTPNQVRVPSYRVICYKHLLLNDIYSVLLGSVGTDGTSKSGCVVPNFGPFGVVGLAEWRRNGDGRGPLCQSSSAFS